MISYDRLCDPLDKDNVNDVATFASDLSGNFAGVVQYNKDNRAFEVHVIYNVLVNLSRSFSVLCALKEIAILRFVN